MKRRRPCRLCFGTGSRYELADPGHHALARVVARDEYLVLVPCPCAEESPVSAPELRLETEGSSV